MLLKTQLRHIIDIIYFYLAIKSSANVNKNPSMHDNDDLDIT